MRQRLEGLDGEPHTPGQLAALMQPKNLRFEHADARMGLNRYRLGSRGLKRSAAATWAVTHKAFWNNTLSCDNAAVPLSPRNGRLATLADFGAAQQYTMLKNSVEGPFYF